MSFDAEIDGKLQMSFRLLVNETNTHRHASPRILRMFILNAAVKKTN